MDDTMAVTTMTSRGGHIWSRRRSTIAGFMRPRVSHRDGPPQGRPRDFPTWAAPDRSTAFRALSENFPRLIAALELSRYVPPLAAVPAN
jgi:hypothetical protein